MLKSLSTFILLIVLLVSGCTIEKRLYRKGWYISSRKEWKSDGSKVQASSKSEQSKIVRQEAASVFSIDTNDLKLGSVADSVNDQLPEYHQKLPETNRELVVGKALKTNNSSAHFTSEKKQDPGYERTGYSRKARAMLVILIGFSFFMLMFLLLINPLSMTTLSLWWFLGIVLILFIGLISMDLSARSLSRIKWFEIKGEGLEMYKSGLREKALKLSVFTLFFCLFLLVLTLPALEFFFLFSSITVILLMLTLAAWRDFRKIRKTVTFFVTENTLNKYKLGEEPFFRSLTPEELSGRKQMRLKKAVFLQVFLMIALTIMALIIVSVNPLTYITISVLALFLCFFSFLIWFELVSKNKHPERERMRVEERFYRSLTAEELAERRKNRLFKSIFLQVFFSVFYGLMLLTMGGGFFALTTFLVLTLIFTFLTFVIWFDLIQKNNHPEREKIRLEQPFTEESVSEEPQSAEESTEKQPEMQTDEEKMSRYKRSMFFLTFAALAFFVVALLIPSEFLWVMCGVFALGAILTLFQFLQFKKSLSTQES